MKKKKISKEIRVGLLAIVAIFILYFGMNFLKGIDIFKPVHYYYAEFSDLDGLVPSSPVFIKGYKVGQVENVQYDFLREQSFVIKISVTKDIQIPKNSAIELFDDGLLGGKAIQLKFAALAEPTAFCRSGDTLKSQVDAGLMGQLTAELLPKIQNIAAQTDSLIFSVRSILADGAIANSLNAIERTSEDLAISSSRLKNMLQNDIQPSLHNLNLITNDFSVVSKNLSNIDFESTVANVDATVKDLKQVSQKINDREGSLGLLLNDKNLYQNLLDVSNSADELLIDLREHPKRYVHFSIFAPKSK